MSREIWSYLLTYVPCSASVLYHALLGRRLARGVAWQGGRKAGPEIRPAHPGPDAGNRNRLVERREAQRFGGEASQA